MCLVVWLPFVVHVRLLIVYQYDYFEQKKSYSDFIIQNVCRLSNKKWLCHERNRHRLVLPMHLPVTMGISLTVSLQNHLEHESFYAK